MTPAVALSRAAIALALACAACVSTATPPALGGRAPAPVDDAAAQRRRIDEFVRVEQTAIGWLAVADPRLAARVGVGAPDDVLKRVGIEAVLAEDTAAQLRGGSLDLFAFRARARALDEAAKVVAAFTAPLPELGTPQDALARPRLERELLARFIEEERARTLDEAELGDASGDLVRGILSTWVPPAAPQDSSDRDVWLQKHLLQIRDSLRAEHPRTGPTDVDMALYPLERLLAPLTFPRGAAAIAEVRVALDADTRARPPVVQAERVTRLASVHLGLKLDARSLVAGIENLAARLRGLAEQTLDASGAGRPQVLRKARQLLLVEGPCPTVSGTRVRALPPPPERSAICGALSALADEAQSPAALVALHDDVLLALAGLTAAPPPRTRLLSTPDDDAVDALRRSARERPVLSLGVALAARILYDGDDAGARLRAWQALGEAPLDVVARELKVSVDL